MSELSIIPVFKEVTSTVGCEIFSAMYFGRHCGRDLLLLKHELTLMLVFRNNDQSFSPEFIKSISSKGVAIKGIQIVGNKNVILLLDEAGGLWKLINAFEFSDKEDERFYLLDEKCFYEWVPFKVSFEKVLAISAWGSGFALLGISQNLQKKLIFLHSSDTDSVKDYSFEEIRTSNCCSFYLTNVRTDAKDFLNENDLKHAENLLITERLTGRTYLCSENGKKTFVNCSNVFLVSVLHLQQENCLLLCFQNGKIIFYFFKNPATECTVYLPKNLALIEKCGCCDSCLLWSDGVSLHHTKLIFHHDEPYVELHHLKLLSNIENPSWIMKIQKDILVVTVNNIYYHVKASSNAAEKIQRQPNEILSELYKGSLRIHELNKKIDSITYFLHCKEAVHKGDISEKIKVSCERSCLVIKNGSSVILKKDFWKVRLMSSAFDKKNVKMADLETDLDEGMVVKLENPSKNRNKVKVSLVGDFDDESLYVDLGEVGEPESVVNELSEHLKQILIKRNPFSSMNK